MEQYRLKIDKTKWSSIGPKKQSELDSNATGQFGNSYRTN